MIVLVEAVRNIEQAGKVLELIRAHQANGAEAGSEFDDWVFRWGAPGGAGGVSVCVWGGGTLGRGAGQEVRETPVARVASLE
jgi:hypothetical protein